MSSLWKFAIPLIAISAAIHADESSTDAHTANYTFKPLLMDGANNSGTVLGIEYGLNKTWAFGEKQKPGSPTDFDPIGNGEGLGQDHLFMQGEIHGVWTPDEDKNPKTYAKTNVGFGYEFFRIKDSIDISAQAAIEGNQNYDETHNVYTGQVLAYHAFTDDMTTYLEGLLAYGQVDAAKDGARKALTSKTKYDRGNAEIYLNIGLPHRDVQYSPIAVGFNFRYFKEINAPVAVTDAKQDEFQYGGIHLKFEKGFYLAYTAGKLPFDQKSDKIFSIGFSQNLF